jgi:signal recognition particle receptor subunit beta
MVFFNYSRMQMAAKIVYYGPGLCGKTTNLHWIYSHTAGESRGEMVSLETETDRTLFFDLLPIDVGNIAGFETRIQLYTVPGQVFYNTTRKLVLKGVDGVVFVADSQRPMLQANLDSFRNLEENLADMGLSLEALPLVLQYNKRDLSDVLVVDELNRALNRNNWAWFEAAAVNGKGVFETLKGISKLTLLSLRQRLARTGAAAERPIPPGAESARPARPPSRPAAAPPPAPGAGREAPAVPPREAAKAAPAARPARAAPPPATPARKPIDALSELERLRREAAPARRAPAARAAAPANGHGQLFRDIQLTLKRADFERARRFSLTLQVEDENNRVVDAVRGLEVEFDDPSRLERVLLKLNIALHSKD